MAETSKPQPPRKILVKDLNENLTCALCGGYFIDATTLIDCLHSFCRACIVRHFESSKVCPNCVTFTHKNKPLSALRSDPILQSLVYKLVPALYSRELQRRADFYHSTSFRANSSCSDDSVLGDGNQDNEEWILSNIGDSGLYFSPDDSISLSLEYYNPEKDLTSEPTAKTSDSDKANNNVSSESTVAVVVSDSQTNSAEKTSKIVDLNGSSEPSKEDSKDGVFRRYLQCPAAVTMSHIMKFLRMKYALTDEHRVDIIYKGEVLPQYFSLMDVAYTFSWKRLGPMRFFYRIFMPVVKPVQPVFTTPMSPPVQTTTQLPASVSQTPTPDLENTSKKRKSTDTEEPDVPAKCKDRKDSVQQNAPVTTDSKLKEPKSEVIKTEPTKTPTTKVEPVKIFTTRSEAKENSKTIKTEKVENNKDVVKSVKFEPPCESARTMPKSKVESLKAEQNSRRNLHSEDKRRPEKKETPVPAPTKTYEDCVYDYTEPDKEEVKAFAERRDREWAMQKHTDTEVYVSKKRKKNKHSKNESMHKKRKLHAEITSNEVLSKSEDSLKLKVKLSVANGHKHRHRNSVTNESTKVNELTPKERLLQMRQVRHKNVVPPEEKVRAAAAAVASEDTQYRIVPPEKTKEVSKPPPPAVVSAPSPTPPKPTPERQPEPVLPAGKTLRSDFSIKTSIFKDICNKFLTVNVDKCVDHSKLLQQQKKTESTQKVDKPTMEKKDVRAEINNKPKGKNGENKSLERAVNRLVEAKREQREEARKTAEPDKQTPTNKPDTNITNNNQIVTKNFTVSKVEVSAKRKAEEQAEADKRPSLEITLINPQINAVNSTARPSSAPSAAMRPETPKVIKTIRPPPPTIPLARIQKSLNLKSGISIIPKASERCDNIGALDLSAKPAKTPNDNNKMDTSTSILSPKTPLKMQITTGGVHGKEPNKVYSEKTPNMSNLQMLSDSAVQILMAKTTSTVPGLIKKSPQPLKIPSVTQQSQLKPGFAHKSLLSSPGTFTPSKPPALLPKGPLLSKTGLTPKTLQKLPKLNEINKSQFCRLGNSQIRNTRPAPNQSIRNIPNPSLLVRQQNQNRINSLGGGIDPDKSTSAVARLAAVLAKQPQDLAANDLKLPEKSSQPPALKAIEAHK